MQTLLSIQGMHCASCKTLIEDVIRETPHVTSCDVDFQTGRAVIEHDAPLDIGHLTKEIASLGDYRVTPAV